MTTGKVRRSDLEEPRVPRVAHQVQLPVYRSEQELSSQLAAMASVRGEGILSAVMDWVRRAVDWLSPSAGRPSPLARC